MFRHHGSTRTHEHNLKIATLLSFVAGSVNVIGFVSVHRLTTNVTGHFAFFVDDVFNLKIYESIVFFLYIFAFFSGAFVSNTLVEGMSRRSEKNIFVIPVILEITILTVIGFSGSYLNEQSPNVIALSLLFAMGLQNALVTKISNAIVRTTHLTGLFTDLGIEISQLFFYTSTEQRQKLHSTIHLRTRIIVFFFTGGVTAGLLYSQTKFYALLLPAGLLTYGLIYDNIRFKILRWAKRNNR